MIAQKMRYRAHTKFKVIDTTLLEFLLRSEIYGKNILRPILLILLSVFILYLKFVQNVTIQAITNHSKPAKMNILSFYRNLKVIVAAVDCSQLRSVIFVLCLAGFYTVAVIGVSGCYSFTGGSIPPHLKTIAIPLASDESNFGNAQLREILTQELVNAFRRDNSFRVVQERSDALLTITITSISEATATVAGTATQGDLERDKQVVVTLSVVYEDLVKQKTLLKEAVSGQQVYAIATGLPGRDAAITRTLRQVADNVLLKVVSGW
jgi:Lipopolysaccharide-assembly